MIKNCCKCGAAIVFVKTPRGDMVAVNAETWKDGEEDFIYAKHRLHLPVCHERRKKQ
jgi:hypothetical protein